MEQIHFFNLFIGYFYLCMYVYVSVGNVHKCADIMLLGIFPLSSAQQNNFN